MPIKRHKPAARSASGDALEREATAILKAAGFNDCGSTREQLLPPGDIARKLETMSDARTARTYGQQQAAGELHPSELAAEENRDALRALIERRNYFTDLTRECRTADESQRRAARGLRRLPRIRSDFEREITVAAIDADLADTGLSASARRDDIAGVLGVSLRTTVTMIVQGRRSIELAKRMAQQAEQPIVEQPIVAPSISSGALLPNVAQAVSGTEFDSRACVAGIAELSIPEQLEFVALLERQAIDGDSDAVDTLDRKRRTPLLQHSILQVLDACGRNSDAVRRTLARLDHGEQKRRVAEWLGEAIDDAIAGTAAQRQQARSELTSREYAERARAWVKRQRTKENTIKECAQ